MTDEETVCTVRYYDGGEEACDAEEQALRDKHAALELKHKRELFRTTAGGKTFFFRCPTTLEGEAALASLSAKTKEGGVKHGVTSSIRLVKLCVVHPEKAELDAIIDRRPGIAISIQGDIIAVFSGDDAEFQKKV